MKRIIKQIIRDFHLSNRFNVKPRDLKIPIKSKKIITLIGVRRCGKTSILYDTINKLTKTIPKEQILFLNFEDERLELNSSNLDLILEGYLELYPYLDLSECYFFFDEIQNIDGWERFIRRVYDTKSQHIYITGSNSKLLSQDIATSLRGRTISYEVYPLSFKEYLNFLDIEIDFYSSKSLAYMQNALLNFLKEGAFPEIIEEDTRTQQKILQEYFNVLIYKDLIERYKVQNIVALKFFLKRLLASTSKPISINKIFNDLKSNGIKISKNSLYDYLEYAQNIFFVLTLERYAPKINLVEKKVYSIDIGLNNALIFNFSDNIGKSMENAVFLELKRQELEIYYYQDRSSECDFIVLDRGKPINAIQVTYSIKDDKTKKREIKGLLNACKAFGLSKGLIVSLEERDSFEVDGIKIEVLPLGEFLILYYTKER
ncbi:MAG: ATP-binding protein [Epsilonproteobacteria bacterium]|nr:ATP-binding protein [Campylobacterota bacterium]